MILSYAITIITYSTYNIIIDATMSLIVIITNKTSVSNSYYVYEAYCQNFFSPNFITTQLNKKEYI